jgi:hypothetical protein
MWYFLMTFHAVQSTVHCFLYEYSWLTRTYVSANAFRAMFPVKVLERECMTLVSSPLIDRTVATVGEICFAKQLADSLSTPTWIVFYAWAAQLCCWYAILTKNNLFHVYEETLWFLIGYTYYEKTRDPRAKIIAGLYCTYMAWVDVPRYVHRFIEHEPVPLTLGMQDMHQCMRAVDWADERVWRTGYFVGATQLSMYLGA